MTLRRHKRWYQKVQYCFSTRLSLRRKVLRYWAESGRGKGEGTAASGLRKSYCLFSARRWASLCPHSYMTVQYSNTVWGTFAKLLGLFLGCFSTLVSGYTIAGTGGKRSGVAWQGEQCALSGHLWETHCCSPLRTATSSTQYRLWQRMNWTRTASQKREFFLQFSVRIFDISKSWKYCRYERTHQLRSDRSWPRTLTAAPRFIGDRELIREGGPFLLLNLPVRWRLFRNTRKNTRRSFCAYRFVIRRQVKCIWNFQLRRWTGDARAVPVFDISPVEFDPSELEVEGAAERFVFSPRSYSSTLLKSVYCFSFPKYTTVVNCV